MEAEKQQMNQNEGVQYRRAKNSTIALAMMQAASVACFYSGIGYVSYAANLGFGITVLLVGTLMTLARIFDGITDPLISIVIDKCNTRFGKIRLFCIVGWVIMAVSMKMMFDWCSGKGHSIALFIVIYFVFYIGYTIMNMAGMLISPVMTNDPKQRPMVGVWSTVYNYIVNIAISIVVMIVLLPQSGNTYSIELLAKISTFTVSLSGIFLLISMIGLSKIDKPENFTASSEGQGNTIKWKDMLNLLKNNKAFQCYILAATSDKVAMTIAGQSIMGTLLYGIVIGNMQLSAILNMIAIFPALIFAVVGGKYTGKKGSKMAVTFWSRISIVVNMVFIVFMLINASQPVAKSVPMMVIFVVLVMIQNGLRVVVSTATGSMQADVVDYEAYLSGKYMPGIIAGAYSFIDKLVSSVGAVFATFCVSLIGYKELMPQPTDEKTMPIVFMVCFMIYGIPILGWICSLIAMKLTPISKEMMVEVQRTIADRKNAA